MLLIQVIYILIAWIYSGLYSCSFGHVHAFLLGWDLLFCTMLASFPLLVGISLIYNSLGSVFLLCNNSSWVGSMFYFCIVFAFLVKMPIFIFHLWLPCLWFYHFGWCVIEDGWLWPSSCFSHII